MSKIGRNDPCPCGSGKKYKKCCIDKPLPNYHLTGESFINHLKKFMTYEEVDEMGTPEIIQRLRKMGIAFEEKELLKDMERFYSAQQISDHWFETFKVTAKGRDEDFPWIAAWVLWARLAPPGLLSMEQLSALMDQGFEHSAAGKPMAACDVWLDVWEALKYRFKPEFKNLYFLDKQYRGSFFVSNFIQDLENELRNAGLEDKTYFEKAINYYREFLDYFPEEDELIIHNMRRATGDAYAGLNNYEQADREYEKLVQDYPDNCWGYIGWGDIYYFGPRKDDARARELFEKALALAKDEDVMAVQERLADL